MLLNQQLSMLDRKPMIWELVLAGPNGSGKSTITQYFDKVGSYTNADDVVATIGISNEKAAILVDQKRYKSLNNIKVLMELCDILHVYDNTIEPTKIIRKHKNDISIFPNRLWSEEQIMNLLEWILPIL